jgi:4-amino-4-deoxy-L-arabinose transferase-like glycosyltransferase
MITDRIGTLEDRFFQNKKIFYIVFSALVLLISLTGLNGSLQNVDETLFARVSRESLEENSWMIQIKDGEKIFFKSPMVFWTAMLSFKFFGVSDFTAKLPSAIANIISSFVILFICVKIFKSYKAGIIAVFIYLCSFQGYGSSCSHLYSFV